MSTRLSIVYTIDTLLTIYLPNVPWLAMRQNNHQSICVGQNIEIEQVYGPAFPKQKQHTYGHIQEVSHYVKGFIVFIVKMDPKAFSSAIYLAVPRSWVRLGPISSIVYRLWYRSLPEPKFVHFMDPTHPIHCSDGLISSPPGTRLCRRTGS